MTGDPEKLKIRRTVWRSKGIIRRLYGKWFSMIAESLAPGKTLEVGGGSGHFQSSFSHVVSTDIVPVPWLDAVADAHALPFRPGSFSNIVLFDVLHHLAEPFTFFFEAHRVLRHKGRVIMIEPYVSWASFPVYRFLHAEGLSLSWTPLATDRTGNQERGPFDGNQAIPTLMFEKYRRPVLKRLADFKIIHEKKTDFFIYPLSGGFHQPSLCPMFLYRFLDTMEDMLRPLHRYLAFRYMIVLEKTN